MADDKKPGTPEYVLDESAEVLLQANAIFAVIQNMMRAGFNMDQMGLMSLCKIGERLTGQQAEIAQEAAEGRNHA
ncbi:hypothetical protein [Burkholderia glumae]|uniref:hypothetical protein n=1 Tax=Burkholderia glumae TaxID=337 RepID=UPI00039CD229|nr:hypothetical protein [Burkholderia glumae]